MADKRKTTVKTLRSATSTIKDMLTKTRKKTEAENKSVSVSPEIQKLDQERAEKRKLSDAQRAAFEKQREEEMKKQRGETFSAMPSIGQTSTSSDKPARNREAEIAASREADKLETPEYESLSKQQRNPKEVLGVTVENNQVYYTTQANERLEGVDAINAAQSDLILKATLFERDKNKEAETKYEIKRAAEQLKSFLLYTKENDSREKKKNEIPQRQRSESTTKYVEMPSPSPAQPVRQMQNLSQQEQPKKTTRSKSVLKEGQTKLEAARSFIKEKVGELKETVKTRSETIKDHFNKPKPPR